MSAKNKHTHIEIETIRRSQQEKERIKNELSIKISKMFDECLEFLKQKNIFQHFSRHTSNIAFPVVNSANRLLGYNQVNTAPLTCRYKLKSRKDFKEISFLYQLDGDFVDGFIKPLFLLVRIENDANSIARISIVCLFVSDRKPFKNFFIDIANEMLSKIKRGIIEHRGIFELDTYEIFSGVMSFDEQTKNRLIIAILGLIKTSLEAALPEVTQELQEERIRIENGVRIHARLLESTSIRSKTSIFSQVNGKSSINA